MAALDCTPWFDGQEKVGGIVIFTEDITRRKRAEQRLAFLNDILDGVRKVNQLINHIHDADELIRRSCDVLVETRSYEAVAIGRVDGKHLLAYARSGEHMAGLEYLLAKGVIPACATEALASARVVIRRSSDERCRGCLVSADLCKEVNELAVAIQHGDSALGFMIICLPHYTEHHLDEISLLTDVANDLGHALNAIAVGKERTLAREQLAETEAQLRQAQKLEAIGRLAGGVAHDFNNILAAQLGYCHLGKGRLDEPEKVAEGFNKIRLCAEHAANLTRQLLAFSRKQILEPRVFDLNQLIDDMVSMIGRLIGEDIRLVTGLDAETGNIKADQGQLQQVVLNLAVNARDAMPDGGRLSITTASAEMEEADAILGAGRYVLLAVSDNGSGMDAQTQARIFEPFFTTKPGDKGTGLGLSTVYGIVRQSGGDIRVHSAPGEGTRFEIYLPCEEKEACPEPGGSHPDLAPGCGGDVLLVEDHAMLREITCEMIAELGYSVHCAGHPDDALALVEQGLRPDLLFTDVVLPGINGRQLADRLAGYMPELKVIFSSGYTQNVILHHGVLDDGISFLQKPFTYEQLAEKIRMTLGES